MQLWVQRSKKNKNAVFVAAEHEGVSAFAEVHASRRKVLRAAWALGALSLRRKLFKGRGTAAQRKDVWRRRKQAYQSKFR